MKNETKKNDTRNPDKYRSSICDDNRDDTVYSGNFRGMYSNFYLDWLS